MFGWVFSFFFLHKWMFLEVVNSNNSQKSLFLQFFKKNLILGGYLNSQALDIWFLLCRYNWILILVWGLLPLIHTFRALDLFKTSSGCSWVLFSNHYCSDLMPSCCRPYSPCFFLVFACKLINEVESAETL